MLDRKKVMIDQGLYRGNDFCSHEKSTLASSKTAPEAAGGPAKTSVKNLFQQRNKYVGGSSSMLKLMKTGAN